MRGITAGAVYVPCFRLATDDIEAAWDTLDASGIERKAVANADEDALTMGVQAAQRALDRTAISAMDLEHVTFATTTPPLDEEMLAPRVAAMLGLPEAVSCLSLTQSTAAGGQALRTALNETEPALIVAADAPEGELASTDHRFGAGAAAFVITDDAAVPVTAVSSHTREYPGIRYRTRGSQDVESLNITSFERSAIRKSVSTAVEALDVDESTVHGVALQQPTGSLPYRLARDLPFDSEQVSRGVVADRLGDVGVATVSIGLLAALETATADETTVAAWFGSGGGTVAIVCNGDLDTDVTNTIEGGEHIPYAKYLRERGYIVDGGVAGGGAHVSVPTWQRSTPQRYRLVAGRCQDCGQLNFPPEGACSACRNRVDYNPVSLAPQGRVCGYTVISPGAAPPEFTDQQQRDGAFGVAIVELPAADGDGTVTAPFQITDTDPTAVSVGDEVQAVLRRIYQQEGLPRYGTKFTAKPSRR